MHTNTILEPDFNDFGPTTEPDHFEPSNRDAEFEMELETAISMMSSDEDIVPEQFALLLHSLMSKASDEGKMLMVENLAKIFDETQKQKEAVSLKTMMETRRPKTNVNIEEVRSLQTCKKQPTMKFILPYHSGHKIAATF